MHRREQRPTAHIQTHTETPRNTLNQILVMIMHAILLWDTISFDGSLALVRPNSRQTRHRTQQTNWNSSCRQPSSTNPIDGSISWLASIERIGVALLQKLPDYARMRQIETCRLGRNEADIGWPDDPTLCKQTNWIVGNRLVDWLDWTFDASIDERIHQSNNKMLLLSKYIVENKQRNNRIESQLWIIMFLMDYFWIKYLTNRT